MSFENFNGYTDCRDFEKCFKENKLKCKDFICKDFIKHKKHYMTSGKKEFIKDNLMSWLDNGDPY